MGTSKPQRRSTTFRPKSEGLETRQLLTGFIRGVDLDGDRWTLTLFGPGDFRVVNQPNSSGDVPIGQPALIQLIEFGGTNAAQSRLVGAVEKSATGDGRVFFENMNELGGTATRRSGAIGIKAIDMPNFWLGDTSPSTTPASGQATGSINIPSGVNTFRFGGIDTTAFFGSGSQLPPNQNGRSDTFTVNLGAPFVLGTSVIVDRVVTANQAATSSTTQPTQDTATFNVVGRLNLFQANSIEGDPTVTGDRFTGNNVGGTTIVSGTSNQFPTISTGAIGDVRIGGNATNLTVVVTGSAAATTERLSNFFVGGETNKVTIEAEGGARNLVFGRGMDTVSVIAGRVETLSANRGAVASTLITRTEASRMNFGGDVFNSSFQAGYRDENGTPSAQPGGAMTVTVAGDVINTIFAASSQPNAEGIYGTTDNLDIPHGTINAKVEGTIDNSNNPEVAPDIPNRAFFARNVRLERGPVVPPTVPEAPYKRRHDPPKTPGLAGIAGLPKGPYYRFVKQLNMRSRNV